MSKLKCYIHPKIKPFYLLYLSMSRKAVLITPSRCDKVGLYFCLCNYSSNKSKRRRSNSFVESVSILFSICFLRYAASALIATRISKSVSLSLRTIRYFFIVITSVRSSEYSITDIGKIINLANQAND